jgi:hypothetical protein
MNPWEMNWASQAPTPPANNAAKAMPWEMKWDATSVPEQKPSPSFGSEALAVGGKLLSGVGYAVVAPEMAADLLRQGINWGVGQVVPGYSDAVAKADALRNQHKLIPSPADVVQKVDASLPQPQSDTGKVLGAVAQAVPSAVALAPNVQSLTNIPQVANAAVRFGAVPAVASEGARQALEGTSLETPGSIVAGLLAGFGAANALPKIKGATAQSTTPTIQDLKTQAKAAYDKVDQVAPIIPAAEYNTTMNRMFTTLANEGFDPTLHPKAAVALRRMDEIRGNDIGFNQLETMRKIAKDAAGSIDASERRIGQIMVRQIDDAVDRIPSNVGAEIKEARSAWQQVKKSETIEDLIQRAKDSAPNYSASGYENAIRREFIKFVKDPDNLRGFTQQEIAAIRHVAQGGLVENILRYAGKLAPTGIVSAAGSGGIGYMLGGPLGAAVAPAVGYLARAGATRATERNANLVSELIRGGKKPVNNTPSAALLYQALTQGR